MEEIVVKNQLELCNIEKDFLGIIIIDFGIKESPAYLCDNVYASKSRYRAINNSTVVIKNYTEITALDNTTIISYDNCLVNACMHSKVELFGNSKCIAKDNSIIIAYNESIVDAYGNSCILSTGNSIINAYDNSRVFSECDSKVKLYDMSLEIKNTVNESDRNFCLYFPQKGII